jgi:predicted metal-dependent enzyme (double-stranded beta helix superfamily)
MFNKTSIESGNTATVTPLGELIVRVREIVRAERNAARVGRAVADMLAHFIGLEDLLNDAQLAADPQDYQQHILHVEGDGSFSIAALVWLPGQETPIHDHVSWCVVGVYRGREYATTYRLVNGDASSLVEERRFVNGAGTIEALVPPGDIHKVGNYGDGVAVSLHIYGADLHKLGCSIRRRYDLPVRG